MNEQKKLLEVLERIAVSLERIADDIQLKIEEPAKTTPFPWNHVSNRVKNSISRYWAAKRYGNNSQFNEFSWPFSCEDLVKIGCDELMHLSNFGVTSATEINDVLESLGFNGWMNSDQ